MKYQFQELEVWQKSMEFVRKVYELTRKFPKEEVYGLTGQLRRAAVSIPANIAEGKGRYHTKEYLNFLHIARGSAYEGLTLIQLARDLGYLAETEAGDLMEKLNHVTAMLNNLVKSLQ